MIDAIESVKFTRHRAADPERIFKNADMVDVTCLECNGVGEHDDLCEFATSMPTVVARTPDGITCVKLPSGWMVNETDPRDAEDHFQNALLPEFKYSRCLLFRGGSSSGYHVWARFPNAQQTTLSTSTSPITSTPRV